MHQNTKATQVRRRHVLILPLIDQYREKIDRHMARYEVAENGCWNWTGRVVVNKKQPDQKYGAVSLNKNTKLFTHRLSYAYHNNKEPGALLVRHKCDNTICMNPNHLLLGTFNDNMNDMKMRNRSTHGERNSHAKLTELEVQIVVVLLQSHSDSEIAEMLENKVTPTAIRNIRSGKAWNRVSGINRDAA